MHKKTAFDLYDFNERDEDEYIENICYHYDLFELIESCEDFEIDESISEEALGKILDKVFDGFNDCIGETLFDKTITYKLEDEEVQFTIAPLKENRLEVDEPKAVLERYRAKIDKLNKPTLKKVIEKDADKYLVNEVKETFVIDLGVYFIEELIKQLANWVGKYKYYEMLRDNLNELNLAFKEVLKEEAYCRSKNSFIKSIDKPLDNRGLFKAIIEPERVKHLIPLGLLIESLVESTYNSESDTAIDDLIKESKNKFTDILFDKLYNYYDGELVSNLKPSNIASMDILRDATRMIVDTARKTSVRPSHISFNLSNGNLFIDISERHVIFGISAEVIKNLGDNLLFNDIESRVEAYKELIFDMLSEYREPYGIAKVDSHVTKDLGVYSSKSLHVLMREYASSPVSSSRARIGVSYYENDTVFAVIEKIPVSNASIKDNVEQPDCIIIDNEKPSREEKEAWLDKIQVRFRVKPFDKKDNTPADVSLEDILFKEN